MVGVIEQLREAIQRVAGLGADAIDPHELGRLVPELEACTNQLDSARAGVVGAWDARQVWALDGAKTGAAWLRHRCRLSGPRASGEIRLARSLRTMHHGAEALAGGEITVDHVRRLASARNERTEACFERDEAILVDAAASLTFAKFDRAVNYWEQLADPDGAEDRAAARHDARRLHLSKTLDGSWMIDGQLDEISGDELDTALATETDRFFDQEWREAEPTPARELTRNPAQRRVDALVNLVRRGHSAGPARRRPLLNVVVDHPSLARACELASGTVITPGQLATLLADADVRTVIFDTAGNPGRATRKRRFFTGLAREMVELRDRECRHPLCDEPASRCEVDHVVAWPKGPTTLDNAQLLCRHHHRLKTGNDPPL